MEDTQVMLKTLANRVDALELSVEKRTPRFLNVATIVSVTALLFSFGTTYVSYTRTASQDIHALRAELRAILQRLVALPKDNFEVNQKYKEDPGAIDFLGGYHNQENSLLARQAAEIVSRLPKDQVSASEFYTVAMALQFSYNFERAQAFAIQAIEAATQRDLNDEVAALRMSGNLFFVSGKPEQGRVVYQKALNIFSGYPGLTDGFVIAVTHVATELNWAGSEASIGSIDLANQHIASAERYASASPAGPGTDALKARIAQDKSRLNSGFRPPAVPRAIP